MFERILAGAVPPNEVQRIDRHRTSLLKPFRACHPREINVQVEYLVTRVFDGGRVMPTHVRHAGTVRGVLSVKQEDDNIRHRTVLVARLSPVAGARSIPPLYHVVLVSSTGDVLTLAGYERVQSGALQHEYTLGQNLRKGEAEWSRLAQMLAETRSSNPPL